MSGYECVSCRRPIPVVVRCPYCGAEQGQWAEELARIERSIADMKARDAALLREQITLAAKLQAAIFQRDVLAHANQEQLKAAARPRGVLRRWPGRRSSGASAPPRIPRQPGSGGSGQPPGAEPPLSVPAETSPRQVQNILLGLGALLLAVTAGVFAAVTDDVTRVAVFAAATALMLGIPPLIARRGLTATAETVAAVGLLLVALDGYVLWTVDQVRAGPLSGPVLGGLTFLTTAAVGAGYAAATGLRSPRFAALLALQPVIPLLMHHWAAGAIGWGLVLNAVAAVDLGLARISRHPRVATPWLGAAARVLAGLAVIAALSYATVALLAASTVTSAARAAVVLLLAAAIGLGLGYSVRRPPLPDVAAGVATLSVMVAAGRLVAVALPGRSLLPIAAVVALTGAGVRALPAIARRGPQVASAIALAVIGAAVSADALGAAVAPVRAALPPWRADLVAYPAHFTAAGDGWQLAATAFLLTVAAVLALPHGLRREFSVVGVALTALAVPASLGLPWWAAPWPAVAAAVGIGVSGISAPTVRAARFHVATAAVAGIAGAGAALTRPGLTAAVLIAIAVTGALIALACATRVEAGPGTSVLAEWAAGGAACALPGAAAASAAAATGTAANATATVLAAGYLATCVTVGYAAVSLVVQRRIGPPLIVGTLLGATAVAAAAFAAPAAGAADLWVGLLVVVAALLLALAPTIDARRRADRLLDGPDYAAAGATLLVSATLIRVAGILVPDAALAAGAAVMLLVAAGVRALAPDWRRGPTLGLIVGGGLIALTASLAAVQGGIAALTTPGELWRGDLREWPLDAALGAWQVPVALVVLAGAAAIALPRPWAYDVAGAFVTLATIGTPAALGLPWWSPIVVGCAVATGYALAAVTATDPRAGLTRAAVSAALALHVLGASLVRPGATAVALAVVAVVGFLVAALARLGTGRLSDDGRDSPRSASGDPMPPHLSLIGGVATTVGLLAVPGASAALAAALGWSAEAALTTALAASCGSLALVGLARPVIAGYLPYATVGIAAAGTAIAIAALFTELPAGVFAAAAALLGVLAELFRAATAAPAGARQPVRGWSVRLGRSLRPSDGEPRWSVSPTTGALVAAAMPAALAVAALAPALTVALVTPYATLNRVWQGPPGDLASPPVGAVAGTDVAAALLLTVAGALAAVGLHNRRTVHAVPVVLPGVALTLLITPVSLDLPWPAGTLAALGVFTVAMLGLALTPPPRRISRTRPIRVNRVLVFGVGLAGGGAGMAGSLASPDLTLFTVGGAVVVGSVAALAGQTRRARVIGWIFAATMAHGFVLTTALYLDVPLAWSAFGVLAVGTALLLAGVALPRLRQEESPPETAVVEWIGHASALLALALVYDSPRHIAALLAAWGAVLGVASVRWQPMRSRILFWAAVGCEITAWWMMMYLADVTLPEAYTLPFAVLALIIGLLELRQRPDLNSWLAYGPALAAALLPTLIVVIAADTSNLRQVLLLLGAVAVLIFGSVRQQQAPVVIGAVVTAITALHALTLVGPWLVLLPVGLTLLLLGAGRERRQRAQDGLRALREMR